jgi:hypothetical protein
MTINRDRRGDDQPGDRPADRCDRDDRDKHPALRAAGQHAAVGQRLPADRPVRRRQGRLFIPPSDDVSVVAAPGGSWSSAQCFTSLEGVSLAL